MTAIQNALGLLWRSWRQSYGGIDKDYLKDLDKFLEDWPVESLSNDRVVDYVLSTDPEPEYQRYGIVTKK